MSRMRSIIGYEVIILLSLNGYVAHKQTIIKNMVNLVDCLGNHS
jgi:hypothetical protein